MDSIEAWQASLTQTFLSFHSVYAIMITRWGWPICETLHFFGLSLLIGAIGAFDLRLMGLGTRIPVAAMHRLIPWGIAGYIINISTGFMFLCGAPDQYIYNSAFHFKMLFMGIAGLNVLAFYSTTFRKVAKLDPGVATPRQAQVIGAVSLLCWTAVIVCGRLLTFYRPLPRF